MLPCRLAGDNIESTRRTLRPGHDHAVSIQAPINGEAESGDLPFL